MKKGENRPFPSCFEPHHESEAKCKVFVVKISFHSYANITNCHMKSFALSLAFIVRFTATRKWPIKNERMRPKTPVVQQTLLGKLRMLFQKKVHSANIYTIPCI